MPEAGLDRARADAEALVAARGERGRKLLRRVALPTALLAGLALAMLPRWPRGLATAALGLVLGLVTVGRNTDCHSEHALWTATVAASPDKPRPWNNLGHALVLEGDLEGAVSRDEAEAGAGSAGR